MGRVVRGRGARNDASFRLLPRVIYVRIHICLRPSLFVQSDIHSANTNPRYPIRYRGVFVRIDFTIFSPSDVTIVQEIQTTCAEVCESCEKKVYPLEKVETNNKIFHKQCFRCLQCNCILRMDSFTLNNGKLYCIPHFKQLFITRGNYDEGFGVDPHKNKWANSSNSTSPSPIAVSNGDL